MTMAIKQAITGKNLRTASVYIFICFAVILVILFLDHYRFFMQIELSDSCKIESMGVRPTQLTNLLAIDDSCQLCRPDTYCSPTV